MNNLLPGFVTTDFCDLYKMDLAMAEGYCEELLAMTDKNGRLKDKPTYTTVIEEKRRVLEKNKEKCHR